MALIDCPDCGKQVSSNAPTCPNCGAPIASESLPYTDHEVAVMQATAQMKNESKPKKKGGCGTVVLVAFAITVGLGVLSKMNQGDNAARHYTSTPTPTPKAQPLVGVELAQLVKECEANQVAFEDKWKGKTVRVEGVVKEIDAGLSGGTLQLRKPGGSRWDSISALGIPRDELAALSKDDRIILQCERVLEVLGDPTLYDCAIQWVGHAR